MNAVRTAALMAFLFALMTGLGYAIGGRGGFVIGLGFALLSNGIAFFASDKIALASARARPVSPEELPELYAMVGYLAGNAGIPMPRLYVMPGDQPNAFATGRSPSHSAIAVTAGILRLLPREELAGVLAHEIAHIKNRDILTQSIAATLGGAIGAIAQFGLLFGGRDEEGRPANPFVLLAGALLAPLAATLIQLALSRTREFVADHDGAMIARDANGLARALARIEGYAEGRPMPVSPSASPMYIINPLGGDRLKGLFRTHPPTEERIARLRELAQDSVRPAF